MFPNGYWNNPSDEAFWYLARSTVVEDRHAPGNFPSGKGQQREGAPAVPSTLKGPFSLQSEAFSSPKETKAQTLTPISEKGCSKRQKNEEYPIIINPDIENSGDSGSWLYQYAWFVEEKEAYAAYLQDFEATLRLNN